MHGACGNLRADTRPIYCTWVAWVPRPRCLDMKYIRCYFAVVAAYPVSVRVQARKMALDKSKTFTMEWRKSIACNVGQYKPTGTIKRQDALTLLIRINNSSYSYGSSAAQALISNPRPPHCVLDSCLLCTCIDLCAKYKPSHCQYK